MKAYLAISGTIFGLLAAMHIVRAVSERQGFNSNPEEFISMTALGCVAARLSIWAWSLFRRAR